MTSYANERLWSADQDKARARLIAQEIVESMTVDEMQDELICRLAQEILDGDVLIDPEEPTCKGSKAEGMP